MSFIKIANLDAAGCDLFAGADSFLTELQPTETTQIFGGSKGRGGWNGGHGGKRSHGGGWNRGHSSKRSHSRGRSYC
jgi:hypothetical protein